MDLLEQLRRDEGERLKPYRDTVGKLTIGVGRNLDDVGISRQESALLLFNDIKRAEADLHNKLPWTDALDEVRRAVLLNMAFNLGITGLLGFTNTLAAVQRGDYEQAAKGMMHSKWARQVGDRAWRLSEQMRTGKWV